MRFDDLISQESSSHSLLSYDSYIKLAKVHGPSFSFWMKEDCAQISGLFLVILVQLS